MIQYKKEGIMMTFIEKFRIAFPQLQEATDDKVEYFYENAQNQMSERVWGKLYNEGILNLTAHLLTMQYGSTGNGLPVTTVKQETTSKTIGKMSKGMTTANSSVYANAGDYAFTVYGRRYWELSQLVITPFIYVG